MREEPKMGDLPDLSAVRFRPPAARPAPSTQHRDYTWQIAGGIFLGLTLFFATYKIIEYYQTKAALEEFERQMIALSKPDADPFGWRKQTAEEQRRKDARERQLYELRPGERCIQGNRFRRVANGWEQVNRPCR